MAAGRSLGVCADVYALIASRDRIAAILLAILPAIHQADKPAIIWESDSPSESRHISYRELYRDVCRMANVLRSYGIGRGNRVAIHLPMVPEAAVAMLACA